MTTTVTTPDRLRRRQRLLGALVMILAVFTVTQATYLTVQDRDQNACFQDRFTELSRVSRIRAGLSEQETRATADVLGVYAKAAGIVKDKPGYKLTPKQRARLNKQLVVVLLKYGKTTDRIQRQRREHPVPPYPVGTCNDSGH